MPKPAKLPSRNPYPSRGSGELVLVVDDEPSMRELTAATLNSFGYRTMTANDGAEAVRLYSDKAGEISLVITDMMMPVMPGPATIDELKRIDPAVKIVAVSGMPINLQVRGSVNAFLYKPYSAMELLRSIERVLKGAVIGGAQI